MVSKSGAWFYIVGKVATENVGINDFNLLIHSTSLPSLILPYIAFMCDGRFISSPTLGSGTVIPIQEMHLHPLITIIPIIARHYPSEIFGIITYRIRRLLAGSSSFPSTAAAEYNSHVCLTNSLNLVTCS